MSGMKSRVKRRNSTDQPRDLASQALEVTLSHPAEKAAHQVAACGNCGCPIKLDETVFFLGSTVFCMAACLREALRQNQCHAAG